MPSPTSTALAALALAFFAKSYTRPPHPYDDRGVDTIPDAIMDALPGNPKGSASPPIYEGAWAPNDRLQKATRLFEGVVVGSESVAVLDDGSLATIDRYGWVFVSKPGSTKAERTWYVGPGRPLGFHAHGDTLLIACSLKGLLELDMATGRLTVLSNVADDTQEPLNYVNDLDVAPNGDVYFTSSTQRSVALDAKRGFYDTLHSYLMNLSAGDASGRLLKYDRATGRTTTLATGFFYANGVALAPDGRSVMVVETNTARVHRVSLSTDPTRPDSDMYVATAEREVFVGRLPAMPDGITRAPDGYWIAGLVKPSPLPKLLAPFPLLRTLVSHVIDVGLSYVSKPVGMVFKVDFDGQPVEALYDFSGERVSYVSCAAQAGSKLYLGNLNGDYVSVLDL